MAPHCVIAQRRVIIYGHYLEGVFLECAHLGRLPAKLADFCHFHAGQAFVLSCGQQSAV